MAPGPGRPRRAQPRPGRPAWSGLAMLNAGLGVAAAYLAVTDGAGWWLLAGMFALITLYWLRTGARLRSGARDGDPTP